MVERRGSGARRAEVALAPGAAHNAPTQTLREHLPGLEAERHVNDWGRSELIDGVVNRTLYDFLYHYWFRVEVEGIENLPSSGPALLVANRAGALPTDALMVAKAVREHHRSERLVHFATERRLGRVPGLDMLITKAGGVSAHPANLHRLLFDEGQLVLVFPEGGPVKPLRERYRLRRFSRLGLLQAAVRARAPLVPVAVLGSEEAMPVLARLPTARGRRLPLAAALPLPAKVRIRFLDPLEPGSGRRSEAEGQVDVNVLAAGLRARIQENLLDMLAGRRSVWLG